MTIATPALALLPAAPASQVSPAAPATAFFESHQTPTELAVIATELAAALGANFSEFSAFLSVSDEGSGSSAPVLRQIRFQELLGFAEPRSAASYEGPPVVPPTEDTGEAAKEPEQIELQNCPQTTLPPAVVLPLPAQAPAAPAHFVPTSSHRLALQDSPTQESRVARQEPPEPLSFALQLKPAAQPARPESDSAVFHLIPELQPAQPASGRAQNSLQAVPEENQTQEPQDSGVPQEDRQTSQPPPAAASDAGAGGHEEHPDRRPELRLAQPRPRAVDAPGQPLEQKEGEILAQPAASHAIAASPGAPSESKESPRLAAGAAPPPPAAAAAPSERPEHARPVREIQLDIGPAGRPEVRLRVLERGGDVVVVARSADQVTSHHLGERLSELTTRLSAQGFETESWTPAPELAPVVEAREGRSTDGNEGNHREFQDQRRSAEGFAQEHENSRRRRGMPAWLEAIEENLDGRRAMKGARQ